MCYVNKDGTKDNDNNNKYRISVRNQTSAN